MVRLSAGTVLADRYRLTALLGEGGMGEVWAARHVLTGKAVAVKRLTCAAHERGFGEARARFALEARSACAVEHPNVVEIFDFVEGDDRAPFMVMELLTGETLSARLARGPFTSARELSRLMLPVVSAVGTAHARGIVHRDLKPSNIFLGARPGEAEVRVKVLDFGIAKWLAGKADDGLRTRTGSTLGTPSYMAPEQATGDRSADHRVDIWSLGVILYEASSGVRPLEGENAAQLVMRLLSSGIMPIEHLVPDLEPELAKMIGRMLSRDVARRPSDLREVYTLLCTLAGIESVAFGPPLGPDAEPAATAFGAAPPSVASSSRALLLAASLPAALSPAALSARALEPPHATEPLHTLTTQTADVIALAREPEPTFATLPASAPPLGATRTIVTRSRWGRGVVLAALALGGAVATQRVLETLAGDDAARQSAATSSLPAVELPHASATVHTTASAAHATPAGVSELHAALSPAAANVTESPVASTPPAQLDRVAARERTSKTPTASARRRSPAASEPSPRSTRPVRAVQATAPVKAAPPVPEAAGVSSAEPAAPPPPAPVRDRPHGAECEHSAECKSRLCVAYACQ